jgi:ATP-dependent HslUV protease ATP-binding subunit HslU
MLARLVRQPPRSAAPYGRVLAVCYRRSLCSSSSQSSLSAAQPTVVVEVPEVSTNVEPKEKDLMMTPREIVDELDKYIIGQTDAKRAVAVAMRNRWRRQRVASPLKEDIMPKNILMIGPTGVGKTEIARRLAKMARAPFIKVEATKFTEVGFVGKDVDQIIRDLADTGIQIAKARALEKIKEKVTARVEEKLLDCLVGPSNIQHNREAFRKLLRMGHLDDRLIEIEVPEKKSGNPQFEGGGGNQFPMNEIILRFDKMMHGRQKMEKREMLLKDSVPILTELESEKMINEDDIKRSAIHLIEQEGIVFIDEIDKICSKNDFRGSADASSEGVQRDLLPLLEGSQVQTKHGNINTDHILFICSGAFHYCKPSDLLAELQGRLPIRVELKSLTENDLHRVLTEPENNLVKQQVAMMKTENVELQITEGAIQRMAKLATEINRDVENIGCRRLHTIIERLMEDLSFSAHDRAGERVVLTEDDVQKSVGDLLKKTDLSRFVL